MGFFTKKKVRVTEPSTTVDAVEEFLKTKRKVTKEDVFGMNTRPYKSIKHGNDQTIFFPETFKGYVFSRKYDDHKVCVITTQRPDYSKIAPFENVILIPEPSNAYDPNAIVIFSKTQKIGYIYRNGFQDILNSRFKQGYLIVGSLVSVDSSKDDISIDIALYV